MKKYQKIIGFIALFFITIAYTYYLRPLVDDELFNYGFAQNIVSGLVPYKDFNMIIPPLFTYLLALIIAIFGQRLLVYHIVLALIIVTITYLSYKKIGLRAIPIYILLLVYPYTGYNMFCVLLLFILINLEENEHTDYLEAILISLMFLTKQTLGILVIPSLIYSKNKKKVFAIYAISISILAIYLLLTNSFGKFLDYCLFGMFDFADKNGTKLKFFFFIELAIIIGLIIAEFKTKRKDVFYCLMFQITAFPIVNYVHFIISFIPVVYITLKSFKKNHFVTLYVTVTAITYFLLLNVGIFTTDDSYKYLTHYGVNNFMKDRVTSNLTESYVFDVKKYLDKYSDHKFYILGNFAYLIKLNNNLPINKFDLINNGNMGYKGPQKYIQEIDDYCSENKCIFIMNDGELAIKNNENQTNKDLLRYVKENYNTEFSSSIFTVYRTRIKK